MRSELARSKVTAQDQTSVPAEVRRTFGIEAGSELLWSLEDGRLVVDLARRTTLEEARAALSKVEIAVSLEDLKAGVKEHLTAKHRHARR